MNATTRWKLSVMFFLEYVIWGAWLPLLGTYLGNNYLKFTALQQPMIFNAFAIASLTGMFFGGQLADRYFSQEKFLAISHLVGGVAIFGLTQATAFWPFFTLMMLHCFFYVPTLSVTNAIAFANLQDAEKDFGFVRLWGTIGWIAAGWLYRLVPEGRPTGMFVIAGVASLLLAAFCLTLPHTPPATKRSEAFAPLEAVKLLAIPSILVLFVVTFFDSMIQACHFYWSGRYFEALGLKQSWVPAALSIGQVMEIVAMAVLGLIIKGLGLRKTLILGICSQAVRFGIYSIGSPGLLWLVIASNLVHGFAYACFFATVYIFVDERFPKDARASAQGLFNLLILGLGPFLGNFLWGYLGDVFGKESLVNGKLVNVVEVAGFHKLFLVPMGIALFAAALLALFFHPPSKDARSPELAGGPLASEPTAAQSY